MIIIILLKIEILSKINKTKMMKVMIAMTFKPKEIKRK